MNFDELIKPVHRPDNRVGYEITYQGVPAIRLCQGFGLSQNTVFVTQSNHPTLAAIQRDMGADMLCVAFHYTVSDMVRSMTNNMGCSPTVLISANLLSDLDPVMREGLDMDVYGGLQTTPQGVVCHYCEYGLRR